MAYEANTGSTSIEYGATLQIGYRPYGSETAFVPLSHFPGYNELPYTFNLPGPGVWEIEYNQICATCSGSRYSNSETAIVAIT